MLKVFKHNELIHVFHMYEDFKYIDEILNHIDYIGISPANDATMESKRNWLIEVFDYIPVVYTHGFAVTALNLMKEFPWYSVDSTSFKLSAGMGSIMTKWGVFNISKESGKSVLNASPAVSVAIKNYVKELGVSELDLYTSDQARYLLNAKYMINLQSELNDGGKDKMYKYNKVQQSLF